MSKSFSLLLLDRDNVVVEVPHGTRYLYGDAPIAFVPGAVDLIRSANNASVPVAIVTNQRGIALPSYPEMTEVTVTQFHTRLINRLRANDAWIDAIYFCPHDESDGCDCRKPKPGLILRALADFSAAKKDAVFVGDRASDLEAARRAGITGILVGRADQSQTTASDQIVLSTVSEAQNMLKRCWQRPAISPSDSDTREITSK